MNPKFTFIELDARVVRGKVESPLHFVMKMKGSFFEA